MMSLLKKYWWVLLILIIPIPGIIGRSATDRFGQKHQIPEGLEYNEPLSFDSISDIHAQPAADSLITDSYLQIWNSYQGGMYQYDFYYPELAAGEIYLRCYEVTDGIRLSKKEITEQSKVEIGQNHSFGKLVDKKGFTIYEGNWEEYYAARIEVWHKDASSGIETKLMEKIYKVEGWMR